MAATEGADQELRRRTSAYAEPPSGGVMYRRFGPVAVGAGLVLALATFFIFAGFTPILPTTGVVLALLLGDLIVVVIVLSLIVIELIQPARGAARLARRSKTSHQTDRAVFAGGGDAGGGHRGRRDRLGRMGDQSGLHARAWRFRE